MEFNLNIPNIDFSIVRRYTLADLEDIDFSSSDDFAIVVDKLRDIITLEKDIDAFWTEDHEQILWQFVIDPGSCILTCYFFQDELMIKCDVPKVPIIELFYLIKIVPEELVSADYHNKLLYGKAQAPLFESLYQTLQIVFLPIFTKGSNWSKCIKVDYLNQLTKFLSELFEIRGRLHQELILYVPEAIKNDDSIENVIEQKEILNQLEETVMKWLWLIKNVMMKQDSDIMESSGPIDEIKVWKLKSSDLENIILQLQRDDVKKCVEILKAAKLVSFSKFSEIYDELQEEYDVALSNVKFLNILMEPCLNIEAASLHELPTHLPLLLDLVRIIWNNSPYFSNENEISNLLSKVNNFVISNISKFIPLEDIFNNKSTDQKEKLLDIISCCNKWLDIFNFSEEVHKKCAPKVWTVKSMSSLVNLFIHRCEELIKVCDYKKEFQCDEDQEKYVKGHKCYNVAKEFKSIEVYFWKLLQELGENKNMALQLRKPTWNESYKKFNEDIFDIEVAISKLMLNGFENLSTVKEGIQILKMFQKYFKKQAIQRDFKRCLKSLYEIYFNEVNFVKATLINLKAPENSNFPFYGGTAFCAANLPRRMEQIFKHLTEMEDSWINEYNINIHSCHTEVLDSRDEYIHTLYLQWIKTIPKDPFSWLKEPVMKKKEGTLLLEINLSSDILNLIQELYYWNKTSVEIPQEVVHLHEKSDVFYKRIMKMMECVKNYNRTIEHLLSEGEEMFVDLMSAMETVILPAISDFIWSIPPHIVKSTLKIFTEQTKIAKEVLSQYEKNNENIKEQCSGIGIKSLFIPKINSPLNFDDFIKMQVSYREDVLQEIATMIKSQINEHNQTYNVFKAKKLKMANVSVCLSKEFNETICSALIDCSLTTLKDVASLFSIQGGNKIQMPLKICLTLKDRQVYYNPNFKELCSSIEQLIQDNEIALSQFMAIDGLNSGSLEEQNYFLDNVKKSELITKLKKEIDFGLYLLYESEKKLKAELDQFAPLWETKMEDLLKEYEYREWNCDDFEKDINKFLDIDKQLQLIPRYRSLEFCLVDCQQLKDSGSKCAGMWKSELGMFLKKISCSNLQAAYDIFDITEAKFKQDPCNIEELKNCIDFLKNMRKSAAEVEYTFPAIKRNFEALIRLGISVEQKAIIRQKNLAEKWKELLREFEKYYVKLQKVQAYFQQNFLSYHQELDQHTDSLEVELIEKGPFQLDCDHSDAMNRISYYHAVYLHLKRKDGIMRKDSVFFHIFLKNIEKLKTIEIILKHLQQSWIYAKQYDSYLLAWGKIPVLQFQVEETKKLSDDLKRNVKHLKKQVKGDHWILLEELLYNLNYLNNYYTMVRNFQEPSIKRRHWEDLGKALNVKGVDPENYFKRDEFSFDSLRNITDDNVFQNVTTISISAREEFKIEQSLEDIDETWKTVCFKLEEYQSLLRVEDTESIVAMIEKHQASLRIMKASKYVGYFSERVHDLGNSFLLILDVVKQAEMFQSKFFLFQKIFSEQAVQAQLPKEASEVKELTHLWKNATEIIANEKLVWNIAHQKGFLDSLTLMNKGVEDVQRSLELYLDSKRRAFPRFYFLSNDDLISIIGQKQPEGLQPYFIKCFDSINKLKLVEKVEETLREKIVTISATGMYSEFEELVEFSNHIPWEGPVESWLLDVEDSMKSTLSSTLPKCIQALSTILSKDDYNFTQNKWLSNFSGQICQLSMLIVWTTDVTANIKIVQETAASNVLKNLRKKWKDILYQFIIRLKSETVMLIQRKALLIVISLSYACDVIESLIKFVCNDVGAFEWLVHLRYYMLEKNTCSIKQAMSEFKYDFEYLGKHESLVITPLTERCFLSLTTALYLYKGVILKGCRSSGKTETLKSLGVALGKYVLAINCSDNLDHKSIVRMLSGVAQIGAWGLFEDFNLVKIEIISLLSQQIQHILKSLSSKKRYFSFLGKDVPLDQGCGLFFVLNPEYSTSGYNCPALFRTVAFKPPDTLTIIQVYLSAYDFHNPKALAIDVQLIFTMAKDQLYQQNHIFGINSLIKFLKYLGKLKNWHPKLLDVEILYISFNDIMFPKLNSFDSSLFESILENVLGTIKKLDLTDSKFSDIVEKTILSNGLQLDKSMSSKLIQLNGMKKTYHSIIFLGESGSGKSTSWQTLKETLTNLKHRGELEYPSVKTYILNPQAYSLNELYGYFTKDRSWKDGLFPSTLRDACGNSKFQEKWIMMNGPVHMDWLCSINSLLDSTKTLTLINGERIILPQEVILMFETTSLEHCAPNLASRCGIVFYESNALQWKLKLYSWIEKLESNIGAHLKKLSVNYLEKLLEFCQNSLNSFAENNSGSKLNSVTSFTNLMSVFMKKIEVDTDILQTTEISRIFWLSATWSIGALLDERDRILFDQCIKELDTSLNLQPSVFDFGLDENFVWKRWPELSKENDELQSNVHFEDYLISNKDTISYQIITEKLLEDLNSVLLIGDRGCGKSILIDNMLQNISHGDSQYIYTTVNISPKTTSLRMQQIFESELDEKAGGLLIPPPGKKLVAVLDDFKIVTFGEFESQSYVELLYMTLDNGIWYNRKKWKVNYVQDVCFLAAGQSTDIYGESTHPLLNRFNVLRVLPLEELTLKHIFVRLLEKKIPEFLEDDSILSIISMACINVYKSINETLLPIPGKLHYLFGIRDLKKILSNLLLLNKSHLNDRLMITKFWFHECCRQFSDRLISPEDKILFTNMLNDIVVKDFSIEPEQIRLEGTEPLFVKFFKQDQGYDTVIDHDSLKNYFEESVLNLDMLNADASYDIVFFKQNVRDLCSIIHSIEKPLGNILLLGAQGVGKKTLCKIAAHVLNQEVYQLNLEVDYGIMDLKHDLHKLLYDVGIRKKGVLFLLSCDEVFENYLFHYLSEILTHGLPHDIFTPDDLSVIYAEISSTSDMPLSEEDCHVLLINNIKDYLHIALCFNSDVILYKTVFLKYPALLKHCTVNWFHQWPDDALETIAVKYLKDINLSPTNSQRFQACCYFLSDMHKSALSYFEEKRSSSGQVFEVSCTFLKLINSFKRVLAKKQKRVHQSLQRLVLGLQKINETQEMVNEIALETKEAQERLRIAETECEIALKAIKEKKVQMAIKKEIIEDKKVEIEKKERICRKIAIQAEEDLNAALPALEEARKALEALNKKDISEIKSYAKPPMLVEMVLEAVMILRDSPASWVEAKRQLGSPSFLKELFEYDRDNISDAALNKIAKYIKKPEFQPNLVGKVSVAAKSLCVWVRAMYLYGEIYKKVRPKKEKLRLAKEELEKLQRTLASLLQELQELEESLLQLEREHKRLLDEKEELARTAKELALKLERAENIIDGLRSEKGKWEKNIAILTQKKEYIEGDSLVITGYLTYLGPYEQTHRSHMGRKWKKKISETVFSCRPDFDVASFFVDEDVMNEWKIHGLPSDEYSYEGASIVTETTYWPFMIDPEEKAVTWLKNIPHTKEIKCADFGGSSWMSVIESAITKGHPVLLQNVNPKFDSSFRTLMAKPKKGSFIYFNDKKLEMDPEFRLFFSTKLLKPQFSSAVTYNATIVNFTIKQKGLEDQLLPLIILSERADLELKKDTLVKNIQDCKNQLAELEDTVLRLLNASHGSLLEDETLVQALAKSRVSSREVHDKLSSSEKTEAIIDSARDKYRPCAKMASILYFVLTDMTLVDVLYVFTLESYTNLFTTSINKSPKDTDPTRRMEKLNIYHQKAVYKYACRSVLEKHSLLLAFHMCTTILLEEEKLDKIEYLFFVQGGKFSDQANQIPNPCSQWLPQQNWDNIAQLERLPKFLSLTVSFDENSRLWHEWYSTPEAEKKPLPGIWRNVCSGFQILLIVRCLRLDRVTSCVRQFVGSTLGDRYLEYPSKDINEVFRDSSPNKPLVLFSLSPDINIEKIINQLAVTLNMKCRCISLGQGQESTASQLIIDSAKLGFWAFIANCHNLPSWLPALEKFVNRLGTIKTHPNFRLWLGLSPTQLFPTSILQNSIIVSLDSPKDIRGSMLNLYEQFITDKDIESSSSQSKYKNMLFSLSFFHSILIGRHKFKNLGWNCDHSLSNEDFKISSTFLKFFLGEYRNTPWDALKTIICETVYGGHLYDWQDENLLKTYFDQCFCDDVNANVKYQLSSVQSYFVPEQKSVAGYVKLISEFPVTEEPEAYGQHSNAEIPHQVEYGKRMLGDLTLINAEELFLKHKSYMVSTIINDIKEKIPDYIDEHTAKDILQEENDPFSKVLVQEAKQYNCLLEKVLKSLDELERSIAGIQMMNEEMDRLFQKILNKEVPEKWQKTYPSIKPLGSWIKDLELRVKQFTNWVTNGTKPVKFWLPGFISPKSLLNAILQTTAKENDVLLKELVWEYHVSTLDESYITEAPKEGIYVSGLLLEGAGWDRTNSILVEQDPMHLVTKMPVINFKPVIESSIRGVYNCPCYYTSNRKDEKGESLYIFSVDLKTKKSKDHWIKRSTSLVLATK